LGIEAIWGNIKEISVEKFILSPSRLNIHQMAIWNPPVVILVVSILVILCVLKPPRISVPIPLSWKTKYSWFPEKFTILLDFGLAPPLGLLFLLAVTAIDFNIIIKY
jgi:hypothetical protein